MSFEKVVVGVMLHRGRLAARVNLADSSQSPVEVCLRLFAFVQSRVASSPKVSP